MLVFREDVSIAVAEARILLLLLLLLCFDCCSTATGFLKLLPSYDGNGKINISNSKRTMQHIVQVLSSWLI